MIPLGGVVQKPATKETSPPARRLRREGRTAPLAAEATHLHSLAHKAYEGLLRILFSGELRPNDVIMERRIAEQLGISRTPLREAIRRLEGEELLQRQTDGAIVICPMSVEDFLNILSIRRLLEGEAARKAAGRVPEQELLGFRERIVALVRKEESYRL